MCLADALLPRCDQDQVQTTLANVSFRPRNRRRTHSGMPLPSEGHPLLQFAGLESQQRDGLGVHLRGRRQSGHDQVDEPLRAAAVDAFDDQDLALRQTGPLAFLPHARAVG